jgi:hypothetical protein
MEVRVIQENRRYALSRTVTGLSPFSLKRGRERRRRRRRRRKCRTFKKG